MNKKNISKAAAILGSIKSEKKRISSTKNALKATMAKKLKAVKRCTDEPTQKEQANVEKNKGEGICLRKTLARESQQGTGAYRGNPQA